MANDPSGLILPDGRTVEETDDVTGGYDIAPADEDGNVAPDDRQPVMTMFLVYVLPDGKSVATSKVAETLEHLQPPQREATFHDFIRSCHEVVTDVTVEMTMQRTVPALLQAQIQMGQQMAEQQQAQRLAQQVMKDPRGRR